MKAEARWWWDAGQVVAHRGLIAVAYYEEDGAPNPPGGGEWDGAGTVEGCACTCTALPDGCGWVVVPCSEHNHVSGDPAFHSRMRADLPGA